MTREQLAGSLSGPVVYVLLPVHNRRDITLAFVECLKKQTYNNFRLVLIDDGSKDGTADAVTEMLGNVIVIRGKGDWWWAGSLQRGHEWLKDNDTAGDDVVLIMNDDTAFDSDFISTGLRVLTDNLETLLTATGYNLKTGKQQDSGGYIMKWETLDFAETYDNAEINCASTRGLMTRVADFLDVGGFYPRLLPHYLSDLEFTMRAQKKGKKLMIHPDFRIGIDFETTGHREIEIAEPFTAYLRKIFSKRAAMNPIHWSNFILLHSPWKFKYSNLHIIWDEVYRQAVRMRLLPNLWKKLSKYIKPKKDGRAKKFVDGFRLRLKRIKSKSSALLARAANSLRVRLGRIKLPDDWITRSANGVRLRLRTIIVLSVAATLAVVALAVGFADTDSYVIRPDGHIEKALSHEFGVPKGDAEFLTHFSGRIVERIPEKAEDLKRDIRERMTRGYEQHGQLLSERHNFDSDRERLIAYMMLRVNGSLPVYKSAALSDNLLGMLGDREGNCGVASTRLLMVLDAFGIKARAIVWYSSSLYGHVFVDAYDPAERKAYLLDSSYNIWSKYENVDEGYLDVLSKMGIENRRNYLQEHMRSFPFYFVEIEGVQQDPDAFRESQQLKAKDDIISALSYEIPSVLSYWKKNYPVSVPYTLDEIRPINDSMKAALEKFKPGNPLPTEPLLTMAGIASKKAGATSKLGF